MARDLRLFYLFRLLATTHLFVPIAVLFFSSRGLGFDKAMLLNTIWCGAVLLFDVPTGALADRIGRRRTMMLGSATMSISCILFYSADTFWMFAVASTLSALAMTMISGADSAYLYDMLSEHGLEHEYPRREGTASAAHFSGLGLAFCFSGLVAKVDLGLPYLITAVTSLGAFMVAANMRESRAPERLRVKLEPLRMLRVYHGHIRTALREIRSQQALMWTIGYSTLLFVLIRVTDYVYPPYLKAAGFDVLTTGLIFGAMYGVAALVALRMDSLRQSFGEGRLLVLLPIALAMSFVILGRFSSAFGVLSMIVPALVIGTLSPLMKPVMNRGIPSSDRRATILSFESMSRRIVFGAFSPLLGIGVKHWGIAAGLYLCAAFAAVGMLALGATSGAVKPLLDVTAGVPATKTGENQPVSAPVRAPTGERAA